MPLRSPLVYEIVRQEGEAELARPPASLWWSAIAAGLGIFPSLVALGALRQGLPDSSWRPLVEGLGYTVGFVIVVLARLQLFTENTITTVLPLLAEWSSSTLAHTLRLWAIVFAGNLVGVAATAALVVYAGIVPESLVSSMVEVGRHFTEHSFAEAFALGIPAGFLIATLVWILPTAEGSEFAVIVTLTYLIAIGGFTHVVLGAAETCLVLFSHGIAIRRAIEILLGTLLGNIIGGTGLFALLAYAQVRMELDDEA